ncbi:MAG TPA: glutathione-regulated potassium-efflux system oxidoreductase KefF [Polyangiales bacterium]|nr:glutathione-regulated potassium-efflux system oxidoreductase KefF [Polyangiales bacterium]
MIDLVFAHPYPNRSHSNRALLEAVRDLPGLEVRSLYDLYPDFAIDVEAEQAALLRAEIVVWQHPLYWYSVPPLLKLWFDKVLAFGWAYGDGAHALRGKVCQWVVTTGGDQLTYRSDALHGFSFEHFIPPLQQTARFCGMHWQSPLVVHGARKLSDDAVREHTGSYRERLSALARGERSEGANG